jgi:eukaryotic-like serine/threonine-protein kinase
MESEGGEYYRSVASIGRQTAEALAYAHARGIVHRDIKPSNLLLDMAGAIWITDFGLAKTHDPRLTHTGDFVGTLRYMAPERFHGEGDERADVYGLGLTLYEMLTLRPAFPAQDRLKLLDHIRTQEPPRPRSIDQRIPRDLETIIQKAMRKDAQRRYQTAEAMADDLRRFLANEPIHARRIGPLERMRLWGRRNPALAALLFMLLLVAVGSTTVAIYLHWLVGVSQAHLRLAQQEKIEGDQKRWLSYLSQARATRMSRRSGQRFDSLEAIKAALQLPVPPGHSRDELRNEAIAALCLPDLKFAREGGPRPLGTSGFAIDPAFQRYAWADKDGNVHICRLTDDVELTHLPGAGQVLGHGGLEFSPNGRFLHQRCKLSSPYHSCLWDLDTSPPRIVLEGNYSDLTFRPDSGECAAAYSDRTVRFFDLSSGRELRRFLIAGIPADRGLSWNPTLPLVLVTTDAWQGLLNVQTGAVNRIALKRLGELANAAWHPEGRVLALSGRSDSKIYLWNVAAARLTTPPLESHAEGGVQVAFDHAGDRLLSTDWSGSASLGDVGSGRQLLSLPGLEVNLYFDGGDRTVGAGGAIGPRMFQFRRGEELRTVAWRGRRRSGYVKGSAIHPDGRLYAVPRNGGVALVDVARGQEAAFLPLSGNAALCFDTSGALWTHGRAGLLRWPTALDSKTGQLRLGPPRRFMGSTSGARHGASRDADVVAIPGPRDAWVWHRKDRRLLRLGAQEDVRFCAVSLDGRWVATGSHSLHNKGGVKIWDARSARHIKDLPVRGRCDVFFSPDNKWLLTASRDDGPRLWAVADWKEGSSLGGTRWNPTGAFSPDGKLLALGDTAFGVVRLIVPDTGTEIARLTAPEQARLDPCCFTPDGARLLAVGEETRNISIFDLRAIRGELTELDLD